MSNNNWKLAELAFATFMVAIIAWNAVGLLFQTDDYTSVEGEQFTTATWGVPVNLNHNNIITNSETVYNSTTTFTASGNYTMDYDAGTIATTVNSSLANNTVYSIDYQCGKVDSAVSNLITVVVSILFFVSILVVILKYVGVKM